MNSKNQTFFFTLFIATVFLVLAARDTCAQAKYIDIVVRDLENRPISNVQLTVIGAGSEERTPPSGKITLVLPENTHPEEKLDLILISAPSGLEIIEPQCRCVSLKDGKVSIVLAPRHVIQFLEERYAQARLISSATGVPDTQKPPKSQTLFKKVTMLIESDFEDEVIKSHIPALIFIEEATSEVFKEMIQRLEEIADEHAAKLKVLFLERRTNTNLVKELNAVQGPSLFLYINGKQVAWKNENMSKKAIIKLIAEAMSSK